MLLIDVQLSVLLSWEPLVTWFWLGDSRGSPTLALQNSLGEARGKDGVQQDRFSSCVPKNIYMGLKKSPILEE